MSEDLREYRTTPTGDGEDMRVSAFVGGSDYGAAIQLTVGREYVQLSEEQVVDLISVLSRRLNREQAMTATGHTKTKRVQPDGEVTR